MVPPLADTALHPVCAYHEAIRTVTSGDGGHLGRTSSGRHKRP
jgi:hypothetical protein